VLLQDIDDFLASTPPAEWRRRATDSIPLGDMPLRTVKTILQQVVVVYKEGVYDKLELIERPENSFVYQYLFRLLNNTRTSGAPNTRDEGTRDDGGPSGHARANSVPERRQASSEPQRPASIASPRAPPQTSLSPKASTRNGHAPSSVVASPSGRNLSLDIELNQTLKEIFDKIGNPMESKKVRSLPWMSDETTHVCVCFLAGYCRTLSVPKGTSPGRRSHQHGGYSRCRMTCRQPI
jgi:cytoskeleton-associated protein 5